MVKVATPAASSGTEVDTPATVKVTAPLGVPVAATGLTVAVKVTVCPTEDGFALLVTTVVEAACGTVTLAVFE